MKLRNMTCIYIENDDKILMMYKTKSRFWNAPKWTGIGGHFEENELNEPDKCILRELFEETGITEKDITPVRLKYITIRKTDTEIRQQYIYFAELINKSKCISDCDEGKMEWVEIEKIFSLHMSFTNLKALQHYFNSGNKNDDIYVLTIANNNGEPVEYIRVIDEY